MSEWSWLRMCFYLNQAASADYVREAARPAELPFERVIEAFAQTNGDRKES
jgi:hypothetical protein